jgi:hypothetical protein
MQINIGSKPQSFNTLDNYDNNNPQSNYYSMKGPYGLPMTAPIPSKKAKQFNLKINDKDLNATAGFNSTRYDKKPIRVKNDFLFAEKYNKVKFRDFKNNTR